MPEENGLDFYDAVVDTEPKSKEFKVKHSGTNREYVIELQEVDRKKVLDEISRLPDEMLEVLSQAEDEEEAEELAQDAGMLSNVDGNTVLAFENLCVASFNDPDGDLTEHHWEDIVPHLSFETLFQAGSKVLEMSFNEDGAITDFQEVSLDKNS